MSLDCHYMITNPTDWPAFTFELVSFKRLKAGFSVFSIDRIPRTKNLRADSLAKGARNIRVLFSHINQIQPFFRNDSSPTTT